MVCGLRILKNLKEAFVLQGCFKIFVLLCIVSLIYLFVCFLVLPLSRITMEESSHSGTERQSLETEKILSTLLPPTPTPMHSTCTQPYRQISKSLLANRQIIKPPIKKNQEDQFWEWLFFLFFWITAKDLRRLQIFLAPALATELPVMLSSMTNRPGSNAKL